MENINKLMGFFELKSSSLPSIPWLEYTGNQVFDPELLWTLRTAVYRGSDLNLPRYVGVNSVDAKDKADELYLKFKDIGIVIYYPYFIAEKSGNLNVYNDRVVIEGVKGDLWNLVTYSDRDVTFLVRGDNKVECIGDDKFFTVEEMDKILQYVPYIRYMFRDSLLNEKSVLLEWSYAYNCNKDKQKLGDKYLVFYEVRAI